MWGIGILTAAGAAAMIVWSSVDVAPLAVAGIIGIVFIGVRARGRRQV